MTVQLVLDGRRQQAFTPLTVIEPLLAIPGISASAVSAIHSPFAFELKDVGPKPYNCGIKLLLFRNSRLRHGQSRDRLRASPAGNDFLSIQSTGCPFCHLSLVAPEQQPGCSWRTGHEGLSFMIQNIDLNLLSFQSKGTTGVVGKACHTGGTVPASQDLLTTGDSCRGVRNIPGCHEPTNCCFFEAFLSTWACSVLKPRKPQL